MKRIKKCFSSRSPTEVGSRPSGDHQDDQYHQLDLVNQDLSSAGHRRSGEAQQVGSSEVNRKLRKHLMLNMNVMPMIKLKMLFSTTSILFLMICSVQAGFFTFYFPNLFKPKGFDELSDMIGAVEDRINETKDAFSDSQYFWGLMQELDTLEGESIYPEESACSDVFPMFRDLAIEYVYIDFQHYIKPMEVYHKNLIESRSEWYPAGLESKAALPRSWEQDLIKSELETKIYSMEKLTNDPKFKGMRERLIEIWKNVRRGLDNSLPCVYLRYAYRQIAEDINQLALESNLKGMREALKMVMSAYDRVNIYKNSDNKVIEDINEEKLKLERFTIRD